MLGVLLAALFLRTGTTYAASMPGGDVTDPVVRAVDVAKPAVLRIITPISGHLDVQFSSGTVTFPQGNGKTYQEQLSGTGTFITANGDILTADHVVSPPPDVLQTAAAPDVANYINQHPETGIAQIVSKKRVPSINWMSPSCTRRSRILPRCSSATPPMCRRKIS